MEFIQSKTILSRVQEDSFFGLSYNMNLYRGCQHGCIYCDSRSACYRMDELSKIYIKENAIELLDKELRTKRLKGTIGTGSMNDPYMPVEKKFEHTRKALEVISDHCFPVHVMTKSDLVLRDLDLLLNLQENYCAVTFTITTADDDLAKNIEPHAPAPSLRFKALEELRKAGIYAGITMMPILPYLNDTHENITKLVDLAKTVDAQYILPYMGVTLREGSRDYFYQQLSNSFPGLKDKYVKNFGNSYGCNSPKANALYNLFYERCRLHEIPTEMQFFKPRSEPQLTLFDSRT
ncbi:MAG: radical SAM protein [FCB group bacterium]|nr:radical SAM protein [FCB group bacterium]MBL7027115.1 radical SAM protein [Candidatus Neomarinimicrobiota bacterium]MBL7122429.1 radical SAM protein [Candidatus Neomarinimicrobiota bacterium]